MSKHHPANEKIKHRYFGYCKDANRMKGSTIEAIAAAISHFEVTTEHKDFKKFRVEWARKYKKTLENSLNHLTGSPLAKATIYSRLMALKAFFKWLADQPGYKSRITYSDAEYFNPSNHDTKIAKTVGDKPTPSLEQIHHVLSVIPTHTIVERRNRALIAFTILTGARDDAIASMTINHVDLVHRLVQQNGRDTRTKFRKSFTTWFFPVGNDIEAIVTEWIKELSEDNLYGPSEPLFPATKVGIGPSCQFEVLGLDRKPWANTDSIRRIFKDAFTTAGLTYFNPHSFRHTLAQLGERICPNAEALKAWSQNLGHESVMTTLRNYGSVTNSRQAEIMNDLRQSSINANNGEPDQATIARVVAHLTKKAS